LTAHVVAIHADNRPAIAVAKSPATRCALGNIMHEGKTVGLQARRQPETTSPQEALLKPPRRLLAATPTPPAHDLVGLARRNWVEAALGTWMAAKIVGQVREKAVRAVHGFAVLGMTPETNVGPELPHRSNQGLLNAVALFGRGGPKSALAAAGTDQVPPVSPRELRHRPAVKTIHAGTAANDVPEARNLENEGLDAANVIAQIHQRVPPSKQLHHLIFRTCQPVILSAGTSSPSVGR